MRKCGFCEELQLLRNHEDKELRYKYKAVLERHSYNGKVLGGVSCGGGHPLRFCPECGKRLGSARKEAAK